MSNWDLMMPGMGLTAIGLAGVVISYAGIAHTFIDGMHALTGLTMFIGLIFLSAGILEGGVSTSNRAKATTLVVIAIGLSYGVTALIYNTISTIPTFASIMMILAIPAIVISYVAVKMPQYTRPIGLIFAMAAIAGVGTYVGFGLAGPDTYLIDEPEVIVDEQEVFDPDAPIFTIAMLEGSAEQGQPDYDPDVAQVPQGHIIEWINEDAVSHTATSSLDFRETFDTGLLDAGESFKLDTSSLEVGEYEYLCIVHPWMVSTLNIE